MEYLIAYDSPGKDKEANWLPSPKGDFGLMLRLYWPNEKAPSILDSSRMRLLCEPSGNPWDVSNPSPSALSPTQRDSSSPPTKN